MQEIKEKNYEKYLEKRGYEKKTIKQIIEITKHYTQWKKSKNIEK